MSNEMIIKGLQAIVTDLAQQADGHAIQSKIFGSQGFTKLQKKYADHATEERGYVDQCIDRILDLGGEVLNEDKKASPSYKDPIDWIKYDMKVSEDGLAALKKIMECAKDDVTTYDFLKDYYKDEEEDLYWDQQQLELVEKIGTQNWYYTLL